MINGSKNCFFVCLQIFLGLLKKAKVHPQKSSKNSSVGIFCIEKETGSSCRRFLLRTHWLFSRVVLKKKVKLIATFMACCHRWTPAKKSDHLLRKKQSTARKIFSNHFVKKLKSSLHFHPAFTNFTYATLDCQNLQCHAL